MEPSTRPYWKMLFDDYKRLDINESLLFLEAVRKENPHRWDYSTMPDSLRKFYSADSKRGE